MHEHLLENWRHSHYFLTKNAKGERRTYYVLLLTAATMIVEIIAGSIFGSMALLADGWHMATHTAAFLLTLFAYRFARRHESNPLFAFGTGKVGVLGGFASAVALLVVALVMAIESIHRLIEPQIIQFSWAIGVAFTGLIINIISAILLKDSHSHSHTDSGAHTHDHNLRGAYLHVLADALTSVLAIIALLSGKYFGWHWLDPVMGMVGAIIITKWSFGLLKQTSPILLDNSIEKNYELQIRDRIENDSDNRISDIHIWKISEHHYAAIISLVTHYPQKPDYYKQLLGDFRRLSHITIEVNYY